MAEEGGASAIGSPGNSLLLVDERIGFGLLQVDAEGEGDDVLPVDGEGRAVDGNGANMAVSL